MKKHLRLIAIFALLTSVFGCGSQSESGADPATLTLFVAASLTDVIQAVGDAYERDSSVHIVYNFASSGALAQQLLAAPRADLFLSASERWMDEVERGDRLLNGSRRTLLSNSLVVIANNGSDYEMEVARDLCELSFAFLATGDPDSVPAGRYARQWLESVGCPDGQGAWSKVDGRLSPTPDVRAALAQVEGSFDVIGIVYRTDYIARQRDVRLIHEIAAADGPRIQYPAAIVNATQRPTMARDFLDFLSSPAAAALFAEHGFTLASDS